MKTITLKHGCTGCGATWGTNEGQCNKCKRCLACCERDAVKFSCAWREKQLQLQLDPFQKNRRFDNQVRAQFIKDRTFNQ